MSTASALGSLAPRLVAAGFKTLHMPFRSRFRLLPRPRFLWDFYTVCRDRSYDVVHVHTEEASLLYLILAKMAGVKRMAVSVHSTFRYRGILRLRKQLERQLARVLGAPFGMVSGGVAGCEWETFRNPGIKVQNWVDTRTFRPPHAQERKLAREAVGVEDGTPILVSVGNCSHPKNHPLLLIALKIVAEKRDFLYIHVGREEDDQPERRLAASLGIARKIRFAGSQEDVRAFLWAADVFVMSSRNEGLPISAVEAIASGCPCVFTAAPGLLDLRPVAPHSRFATPTAACLAEEIVSMLSTPAIERVQQALDASDTARKVFSPASGVDLLCDQLYCFGAAQ